MKKLKSVTIYLFIIGLMLSMSSCTQSLADKVSIEGYENLEIKGFSGVTVDVILRNVSRRDIEVRDVTATLNEGKDHVGTLELKGWLGLPRRTESVTLPTVWRLTDIDQMEALLVSKAILAGESLEKYYVNIQADVTVGKVTRTVERKYIPLTEVMEMVGLEIKNRKK